jgi:hypothetical protein
MGLDESDIRGISELADALLEKEAAQNNTSISEFAKYQPLFILNNGLSAIEVRNLSSEFISKYNPYKPITINDTNGELLFTIPQLFIPLKDISKEYLEYVDKFRQDGNSDIPRYSSEATQGLLLAIMKSQKNVDNTEYKSYKEYINKLSIDYQKELVRFGAKKLAQQSSATDIVSDKDTPPIDSIGGLSWD